MKQLAIFSVALIISLSTLAQMKKGIDALNAEMYPTSKLCFINQFRDTLTRPEVCYYLGEVYRLTENSDSVMIYYNMGIDCSSPNPLCMAGKAGLLMADNPVKASNLIKEANSVKSYKKNPALQVAIAKAYANNNKYSEANELLTLAAEKYPKYIDIYLTEGDILLKQKKISDATNKYETAIYYDTLCKPAYLKIARIYYLTKYYDKSFANIKKLNEIDQHYSAATKLSGDLYYEQGKYADAVTAYAEYIQTPEAGINDQIRYAYALFFNKEYEKSLAEIKQIVPQIQGNQFLKRIMAYNLYEIGNYSDGLIQMESFLNVAEPSTILPSDYKYYARLLFKNNHDSLSAINYQKAIALSKDPQDYYKEVALLYERMKQYNNASLYFEKHIKTTTNPANSDLFFWGRDCYFAAGAIDSAAIARDSSKANVRRNLYEKADSIFNQVTVASPNNYLGSFWRARVNSILDPDSELGLAKPYYERVIELLVQPGKNNKKELIEAYQYLGYYYYLKNDFSNSKLYWKKILEIEPDHAIAKQAMKGIK